MHSCAGRRPVLDSPAGPTILALHGTTPSVSRRYVRAAKATFPSCWCENVTMCGIGGWVGHVENPSAVAAGLIDRMRRRGPDGSGQKTFDGAALLHTRLRIIDLSEAASEPMPNEDGTVWSVFNGEIYNHHELRRQLEERGHRFVSRCDAEVIPHLFEEMGTDAVPLLRGMFALAVWDTRNRTLTLARDRFGIKPLFYATAGSRPDAVLFASDVGALAAVPGVDASPDPQALSDFAALTFTPAPVTFFSGVRALEPCQTVTVQLAGDGTPVVERPRTYHQWMINPQRDLTLGQAELTAAKLLNSAVGSQVESDVPLGAMLSGGIDSSLVSYEAQIALDGRLSTYSVRFPDEQYDETHAALAVARHIRSTHEVVDMENLRLEWGEVTSLLRWAGQPFADTSIFGAHAVSKALRRSVTVALSGDGGDEGFGGYDDYGHLGRAITLARAPRQARGAIGTVVGLMEGAGLARSAETAVAKALPGTDNVSIVEYLQRWLRSDEHARLCAGLDALPPRRLFEPVWQHHLWPGASRKERLSALLTEVRTRVVLANDYLPQVDLASMNVSLEVRVPLLDEDLFGFGLTLPHNLKLRGKVSKPVLRQLAAERLPEAVARKPKHGFGVPVDTLATDEFRRCLRERLLAPNSRLRDVYDPAVYSPMVTAFAEGKLVEGISRQGLHQRVIMLLAVDLALEGPTG